MKTKSETPRTGFKSAPVGNTPNSLARPLSEPVTHEAISTRAQALWQERGRPYGRDDEIWLEAERQLGGRSPRRGDLHDTAQDIEDVNKLEERLDETGEPTDPRSPTSL